MHRKPWCFTCPKRYTLLFFTVCCSVTVWRYVLLASSPLQNAAFVHINPFVVLGLHKTLTLALTHAPAIYLKEYIKASATLIAEPGYWNTEYITCLNEKGSSSIQYCTQGFIARSDIWAFLSHTIYLQNKNRPICLTGLSFAGDRYARPYLANSIARVSRITLTLIVPGYCMVLSILVAMSRASLMALKSSTTSGRTITRTSRPALIA